MDTETVITGGDFETLYAALVADAVPVKLPANFFTLTQFQADTGLARVTAARNLGALVTDGQLKTRRVILDGHIQRIYWFQNDDEVVENGV